MQYRISKLAIRLTQWFLLLSIIPIMILIVFVQSNIVSLILAEYRENLNNRLHYVLNSINDENGTNFDTEVIFAQFGDTSQYFIIANNEQIIATNMTGKRFPEDFSDAQIKAINTPLDECHMLDQSKTYFCVAAIPNTNHELIIVKDAQRILTNINELQNKSILQIAVGLLLMAIATGIIIWMIIGKPISILIGATKRIGQGDYSTTIDTSAMTDELSDLGETFNQMSHQLFTVNQNQVEQIAELSRVKTALEKSQENLQTFFHSINDYVFVIDDRENILFTNQLVETQMGYKLGDVIGENIDKLFIRAHQFETGTLASYLPANTIKGILIAQNGGRTEVEMKLSNGSWNEQSAIFGVARDITEHTRAEQEIKKQIQRLESLHKIDLAITGTMDMSITMKVLLHQVNKQMEMAGSSIVLYESATNQLQYYAEEGFNVNNFQGFSTYMGEGLAGKAAIERKLIISRQVKFNPMNHPAYLDNWEFETVYDMPLIAKGELKGILELYSNNQPIEEPDWHNYLATLATQAALAIDNTRLFNDMQRINTELYLAYDITLEGLVKILELRDLESRQHSERTTDMTMAFIKEFNFREAQLQHIRRGALLHDIGKMGIPDQILNKPGPLTEKEWDVIRQHPIIAYELISKIPFLRPAIAIPYCHHERWDGSGYPRGLENDQIPLEARIFSVIDVWDALTHDCVFRKAWTPNDALRYIEENAGSQFDPHVAELFLRFIQQYEFA